MVRGPQGFQGLSAYQVWLAEGNSGTVDDFITSLCTTLDPLTATSLVVTGLTTSGALISNSVAATTSTNTYDAALPGGMWLANLNTVSVPEGSLTNTTGPLRAVSKYMVDDSHASHPEIQFTPILYWQATETVSGSTTTQFDYNIGSLLRDYMGTAGDPESVCKLNVYIQSNPNEAAGSSSLSTLFDMYVQNKKITYSAPDTYLHVRIDNYRSVSDDVIIDMLVMLASGTL